VDILLLSQLPLVSLLEIEVIEEKVEWSEVEEEADIEESEDLSDSSQEDEEAVIVRALTLQV